MAVALPDDPFAPYDAGNDRLDADTAALVLLMTPGLAFFYGGMVRGRRPSST